jgi:hypothetical protein
LTSDAVWWSDKFQKPRKKLMTPTIHDQVAMMCQSIALRDVADERHRQVYNEGRTPDSDLEYRNDELANAAASYALPVGLRAINEMGVPFAWPWPKEWWKPYSRRHDLVRAAALLVAEIERMDRAETVRT